MKPRPLSTIPSKLFFNPHCFLLVVIGLLILGCREPIDLNFPASDPKLVVDGFITNVEKEHLIKLSFSHGFTERGENDPQFIETANVEIVDDLDNSFVLTHRSNGQYFTPTMRAEVGRSYKIVIRLEDERYESTFQRAPEHIEIAKIKYEPSSREVLSSNEGAITTQYGVSLIADFDNVAEPVYYHWLQQDYYIYDANLAPTTYQGVPFVNKYCYVRDLDRIQVDIFENVPRTSAQVVDLEIGFIPTSLKLYHDFSVHITQLITNRESYEYWSSILEQAESVGSQFDAAPASIYGNIKNGQGVESLGFFGVYNESTTRVFFYNCELPITHRKIIDECLPAPTLADALLDPCYDCLNAPGIWSTLEAPAWWRYETVRFLGEDERSCIDGGGG